MDLMQMTKTLEIMHSISWQVRKPKLQMLQKKKAQNLYVEYATFYHNHNQQLRRFSKIMLI